MSRQEEQFRAFAKKRMQYGMLGLAAGYLVGNFAVATLVAPMTVSTECRQLSQRMQIEGTAHMKPDPATGKLSPQQEQLASCFQNYSTLSLFMPLAFMLGGNIAGHRYADRKFKPQPPKP